METRVRGRSAKQAGALLTIWACAVMCGTTYSTAAVAAEKLVFDPALSLTGTCSTSEDDPVPDPGCPAGEHPPAGAFSLPQSVATDSYGDIYVASYGNVNANGVDGRIDIFDSRGEFLTEIPDAAGPKNLAIDSEGYLYVFQFRAGMFRKVERYKPSVYEPAASKVQYANPPEEIVSSLTPATGLAVDPTNDHLFVHLGTVVQEFTSATDGNKPLDQIGVGSFNTAHAPFGLGLSIDSTRGRIYASDKRDSSSEDFLIDVFELSAPHSLIQRLDGSATPTGEFSSEMSLAVNEATGDVFAYPEGKAVFELTDEGESVDVVEYPLIKEVFGAEINVDNGPLSPHVGYLFLPSHPTGVGHSFAFGPREVCVADVTSASVANVTENEAEVSGTIKPCGLETSYVVEFTTLQNFDTEGFEGAQVAKQGQLPAGAAPVSVSSSLRGLSPGTAYRFRLSAENELGGDVVEGEFRTYPAAVTFEPCPNDAVRTGFSALLPDCRAYELVTPPETNARAPRGVGALGPYFPTREASPAGSRLSFITEGGALPGSEGTGSLGGDSYLSKREAIGWVTLPAGPSGAEAVSPLPGGISPDQGYSFWSSGSEGSAAIGGKDAAYVRYPDGQSKFVGRGSLHNDPRAEGKLITENGGHIIFISPNFSEIGGSHKAVQLEPNAPPEGTEAVYDRTADEVTHVVSLLPDSETPKAGENARYVGASLDGKGIAFSIGSVLYLRYNYEKTFAIGDGVTFAGIAEGGKYIFYVKEGKLLRFDTLSKGVTAFNATGTAIPVNVSPSGAAAYFVSTAVLTSEANPNGAQAQAGQQNLYLSEEGAISFVATVTEEDVKGENAVTGLGRWTPHVVSFGEAAEDPSRLTPDGRVLLFESRANLTDYESNGHTQIYRYDSTGRALTCLSCNPTKAPASGEATLQSIGGQPGDPNPLSVFGFIPNLSQGGRRAFFQSTERLVPIDTDGLQDVYEWEAQGVGSCIRAGGCVYLISSGQSARVNHLYAVSDSGDDVFFRSSDLLLSVDLEETPSIYDARINESAIHAGAKRKPCPKGTRKVRRKGKVVCVKKKHNKKHRRRHKRGGKTRGAAK
jgi:hypothetical protein